MGSGKGWYAQACVCVHLGHGEKWLASSLAAVRDGVGACSILRSVCRCTSLSTRAAANEHQVAALQSYVACFRDGTLASHVQGSRHWVQDKGPTVESYIGFIESYQLRWVYWSRRLYVEARRVTVCLSCTAHAGEVVSSSTEGFECVPSCESLVVWTLCCVCAAPCTVRRDPFGVRGEWEGFVACVNAAQTIKFSTLVAEAEKV